ncbi:hypothetical protein ACIA5D_25610 [Actinoplanes sp. NPDC051513]|uniref:hypothetical protein n=1 Tax=Actinoplanes sp. NPDC051513 TaxID=3363908 RepID=UPI00378E6A47
MAGQVDVCRAVVARRILVPGDHVSRGERGDHVERPVPAFGAAVAGFGEVLVDVVVDHVTGGDQAD